MILITAYSEKMDGFAFLSQQNDNEKALEDLTEQCKKVGLNYKIVKNDETTYLVNSNFENGDLKELDGEPPRWDGWSLFLGKVHKDGWISEDAICW